jgi:crossover junction endodeoxyribonuclease RuvC
MIVLGVDPGAANTGFGVVRSGGGRMVALDGGVIETQPRQPLERRLHRIHEALLELVEWHEPDAFAVENVYFGHNARSAFAVGQARGVALLAAAIKGVACFDYTPQAVKLAVCGAGGAGKRQVQRMVATLLGLERPPASDHAADALAVAICHAGSVGMRGAVAELGTPAPAAAFGA